MYWFGKSDNQYELIVPVLAADELFTGRTFDVAKISVQGYEPEVVLGMQRIIHESPAIVMVVDFRPSLLIQTRA